MDLETLILTNDEVEKFLSLSEVIEAAASCVRCFFLHRVA